MQQPQHTHVATLAKHQGKTKKLSSHRPQPADEIVRLVERTGRLSERMADASGSSRGDEEGGSSPWRQCNRDHRQG